MSGLEIWQVKLPTGHVVNGVLLSIQVDSYFDKYAIGCDYHINRILRDIDSTEAHRLWRDMWWDCGQSRELTPFIKWLLQQFFVEKNGTFIPHTPQWFLDWEKAYLDWEYNQPWQWGI